MHRLRHYLGLAGIVLLSVFLPLRHRGTESHPHRAHETVCLHIRCHSPVHTYIDKESQEENPSTYSVYAHLPIALASQSVIPHMCTKISL